MVYRLAYNDVTGVKHVQYGKDAAFHRPTFLALRLTEKFSNITIHESLDSARQGIERHIKDSGVDIGIFIEYAYDRSGKWEAMTTDSNYKKQLDNLINF